MKACNPDVHHFHHIATSVSPAFALLSGEDTHFPLHMAMGAKGGILASASLVAAYWGRIYRHCLDNDLRAAMALHRDLLPLIDAIFVEPNPGPLKVAMRMIGHPAGEVLAPLVAPCTDTVKRLEQALHRLHAHA